MKTSTLMKFGYHAVLVALAMFVGIQVGEWRASHRPKTMRPERRAVVALKARDKRAPTGHLEVALVRNAPRPAPAKVVRELGQAPATVLGRGLCTHLGHEYVAEWTSPTRSTASVLCRGRGHFVSDNRPYYSIWRVADGAVWVDKILDW